MQTGLWIFICMLCSAACVSTGVKFDPTARIEKYQTTFGSTYRQHGQPIDGRQLVEALEKEPDARDDVASWRLASALANGLSAGGGVLIGWPVGEALMNRDAHWKLALAGTAFVAVAISLAVVAAGDFEDAIDNHNRYAVRQTPERDGAAQKVERALARARDAAPPKVIQSQP